MMKWKWNKMNERIRELAQQAGYKDLPTVRLAFQGFDKEKFAELIVRECLKVGEDYSEDFYHFKDEILKHFGVEE